jgi:hypothetical protein
VSTAPAADPAVPIALRTAAAVVLSIVVAEWFHLDFAYLAPVAAYRSMAQAAASTFQKGLERAGGRGLGILIGVALVEVFHDMPLAGTLLKLVVLEVFFYVYHSGRLADTFLQGGMYLAVVVEIGYDDPSRAGPAGWAMWWSVVTGVVVADLVSWVSEAKPADFRIKGEPLFPIRGLWLNRAGLLVISVALAQTLTRLAGLNAETTLVSVLLVAVQADRMAIATRGWDRFGGAVLGGLAALAASAVLAIMPHFLLFLAFVALGVYVGAYVGVAASRHAYLGIQFGQVLLMVMVVPPEELGGGSVATQRAVGVVVATASTLAVSAVWPAWREPAPQ